MGLDTIGEPILTDTFGIYRDVNVIVEQKHPGYKGGFNRFLGDIPVAVFGGPQLVQAVVNTRGIAYAHRNAKRFLPTKAERLAKVRDAED